jgi:hypothetical protein
MKTENYEQISRKSLKHLCESRPVNLKSNFNFSLLFIVFAPILTILFAIMFGGIENVVFSWLPAVPFAFWIAEGFGVSNKTGLDCTYNIPCMYECPMGYPDWCPHKHSPKRYEKSPYQITD